MALCKFPNKKAQYLACNSLRLSRPALALRTRAVFVCDDGGSFLNDVDIDGLSFDIIGGFLLVTLLTATKDTKISVNDAKENNIRPLKTYLKNCYMTHLRYDTIFETTISCLPQFSYHFPLFQAFSLTRQVNMELEEEKIEL